MNKYQKKEARIVRESMNRCYMFEIPHNDYKIMRRNLRKATRILSKRNKQAHKKAIRGIDLANGPDKTVYIRRDLFNTIYIARPIEVKNE